MDSKNNDKGETEPAYFTGTIKFWKTVKSESSGLLEVKVIEYDWESSTTNENVKKVINKSVSPVMPPAGKKMTGSHEGFRAMSPLKWKREVKEKDGKEEVIKESFTDKAQEYGNVLLNKVCSPTNLAFVTTNIRLVTIDEI